jgi:hypothetical protein
MGIEMIHARLPDLHIRQKEVCRLLITSLPMFSHIHLVIIPHCHALSSYEEMKET